MLRRHRPRRHGAAGRGVITAAKSDNNATIAAARFTYRRLLRRGVEIYEYRATKLHTKLVVLDDVVHIGSSNLDIRSLYLNMELMLRVDDGEFAQLMRAISRESCEQMRADHARAPEASARPCSTASAGRCPSSS